MSNIMIMMMTIYDRTDYDGDDDTKMTNIIIS